MRNLINLIVLLFAGTSIAQYSVDLNKAPLNSIPVKHTLAHFNLKGPVEVFDNGISTYFFNNKGKLIRQTASLGGDYVYTYDSANRLNRIKTEVYGMTLDYKIYYDSQGRINKKATDGTQVGEVYVYDGRGNYVELRSALDNDLKNKYTYDAKGRVVLEEYFYNLINQSSKKTFEYSNVNGAIKASTVFTSSKDNIPKPATSFYIDGNYRGSSRAYPMNQVDKYGNYLTFLNGDGSKSGTKMYKYLDGSTSVNYVEKQEPIASVESPVQVNSPMSTNDCVSGDCTNGWGRRNYKNDYYEGFWNNGKKEGYGMYIWEGQGKYIGSWINDIMSGYGVYIAENKDNIIGEYSNGQLNGRGIEIIADKYTQGLFSSGQMSTKYTFFTNNVDTGCTAGDCQNKYGRMKWSNGDVFTGFFKNGTMFLGTYVFADGSKYSGQFNASGQFHGMGRFFFTDNSYYGGSWANGKFSGLGYFHNKAYEQQIGEWAAGKLIKSYK